MQQEWECFKADLVRGDIGIERIESSSQINFPASMDQSDVCFHLAIIKGHVDAWTRFFFEWVPKLARRSFHYVPHDAPQARLFEQPNKETLELLISFDEIQPIAISIMPETCVRGHG